MMRQYFAQRRQGGPNPYGVGVIPIGAIFYIQDESFWRERFRGRPTCRNPWIVEAFLNGTLGAARKNAATGKWEDAYISHRSDIAVVRSLRNNKRRHIAVRLLILHEDEGHSASPLQYPTLPRHTQTKPAPTQNAPSSKARNNNLRPAATRSA
jgi:hypothetical protein